MFSIGMCVIDFVQSLALVDMLIILILVRMTSGKLMASFSLLMLQAGEMDVL